MSITLTSAEWDELWAESEAKSLYSPAHEPFLEVCAVPDRIGQGTNQLIALYPEVWLEITHRTYPQAVRVKLPEAAHPLEFGFLLLGQIVDSNNEALSQNYTMISGSGIQPKLACQMFGDYQGHLSIIMSPERLGNFFPNEQGNLPAELEFLVKGEDWQTLIYPRSNSAIRQVVKEIIHCPHQGFAKRLFLQLKVTELLGLQLMAVLKDRGMHSQPSRLKPQTIAQIYAARELLLANLEHPPSSLELAQRVGISDRTLLRGFHELFGKTVFGYLTEQRMTQAEQWLREKTRTVAEVAALVGYSNQSHFSTAFKNQFGITPRDCLSGKKSVLR